MDIFDYTHMCECGHPSELHLGAGECEFHGIGEGLGGMVPPEVGDATVPWVDHCHHFRAVLGGLGR
jgi:hypothetical protein